MDPKEKREHSIQEYLIKFMRIFVYIAFWEDPLSYYIGTRISNEKKNEQQIYLFTAFG